MLTDLPVVRGTTIVLIKGANGAIAGDVGKVASRKKNGWLRVTIGRTGKTISIRNGCGRIGIKAPHHPNPVRKSSLADTVQMLEEWEECSLSSEDGDEEKLSTDAQEALAIVRVATTEALQRINYLECEIKKRDKWLERAKDIIKEYQKRHEPINASMRKTLDGEFEYARNRW